MIASSAARSTWVTKSFARFAFTTSASPPSAARLMIEPARRAARTAILSMGCIAAAYSTGYAKYPDRALPPQPSRQHRRGGARDEDDGPRRSAPSRAPALSRARGAVDGDARARCSSILEDLPQPRGSDRRLRRGVRHVGTAAGVVAAGAR